MLKEVYGCSISYDGSLLASVSNDHTVRIWNASNGECVSALRVEDSLRVCRWSVKNYSLCVGGTDGLYAFLFEYYQDHWDLNN